VEAARREGRGCSFASMGPEWLQRRAGRYSYLLRRVRELWVAGPDAGARMADLHRLKYLDRLTLVRPTDEMMAGLSGARGIRELWVLAYGNLTDEGVSHIRDLPRLQQLHVHFTPASGPKAGALGTMPSVWYLSLVATRTNDASLAELRGLNYLRMLNLSETAVTDAGLHELATLAGLESVDLTDTGVTEAGLADLRRCRRLSSLRISFIPGDDGIASLKQFPALRYLNITSSRRGPGQGWMTRADYEHLRRELPHVIGSPPPW
jgi:hypothetical protein